MNRNGKRLATIVLAFGFAGSTAFVMAESNANQPPFGKGGQPGQPPFGGKDFKQPFGKDGQPPFGKSGEERKKGEDKKFDEKKGPGPKSDAVVDAWLRVLIEKITDPHDTVRESARGAIVAVGRPAIPALQRLVDGDDPAKAVAARKLIGAIDSGRGPGPQGQPGQPGRGFGGPGMSPMGPGNPDRRGGEPARDRDRDRDRGPGGMGFGGFGGFEFGSDRDRGRDWREGNRPQPPIAPFPGMPGRQRRDN